MEPRKAKNKRIGRLGEDVATKYLVDRGCEVVARNYTKPWAELDIIVRFQDTVHFVEVKTVSYGTKDQLDWAVAHETWRPEEMVHQHKLHQIRKGVLSWLEETGYTGNWQIDVAAVRIVPRETYATVNIIPNVGIE